MRIQQITGLDRDRLARKCHLYIPMELVYEAEKWAISIDDTCIEALRRKIHAQKKAYYFALNQPPHDPI
jgi:hypothetical protein